MNSAVHHHRDHDDTVRAHAEIGASLRERKEARRLAIFRNLEQAAAYPVGDKIAALAIGLDAIEITGRCRVTKSRHFLRREIDRLHVAGTSVEKSGAILPHDATTSSPVLGEEPVRVVAACHPASGGEPAVDSHFRPYFD